MTGAQALAAALQQLRAAQVPDAPRDARRLLAHALGVEASRLTLVLPDEIDAQAQQRFREAIERRVAREPVFHIIGSRAFYGREFQVSPDVLDPRPETEILVALALEQPFERVLDLGTGSGCIVLSLLLERPGAQGLGVDISDAALRVAAANAAALGATAQFQRGDWCAGLTGQFDLIVSNPPYIAAAEMAALAPELAHEPQGALSPGGDGLDAYRAIAAQAPLHLAPGGRLLVEIGPSQAAAVTQFFGAAGLEGLQTHADLDGRDRVVAARKPFT